MEKREAESEECLLLALLTSTTASDFITRRHETYRCTCTALLGHNMHDRSEVHTASAHGVHYFCLCYTLSCSQANQKAGLGMWLYNLWPRKLSMWDGDYLESVSSSVFRLPSISWAAPTEFMLLTITASAVKLFNPWINATVSVLGSIVFSIQDGASPLIMLIDVFASFDCYIRGPCLILWDRQNY